jgi:hypothetical protein
MREIVYLSGKITGSSEFKNEFADAERFLLDKGYIVLNPAKLDLISPDLTYAEYMAICYRLIDISDIVFMLAEWKHSKGATAELKYAKSLGKKIMYQNYFSPFRKGANDEHESNTKEDIE